MITHKTIDEFLKYHEIIYEEDVDGLWWNHGLVYFNKKDKNNDKKYNSLIYLILFWDCNLHNKKCIADCYSGDDCGRVDEFNKLSNKLYKERPDIVMYLKRKLEEKESK